LDVGKQSIDSHFSRHKKSRGKLETYVTNTEYNYFIMTGLDSNTKLTLVYFPIGGRAEAVRLTAAAGGIPFTNKVMTFPEFKEAKENADLMPLGQLPVLEIEKDGIKSVVAQSGAILRYFGKLGGLYPSSDVDAMQVDSMLYLLEDLAGAIILSVKGAVRSHISNDEWADDVKLGIRKRWLETDVPKFLGFIEKSLEKSASGWLVGDTPTVADIKLYTDLTWYFGGVLDGIPTNLLDSYPACKALMKKVEAIDGVHKWMEQYSKPYATFDFKP
jgi:Glutathione S-transferase